MTETPRHARTRGAQAALLSGIWEGRPLGQTLLALVLTAGSIPLLLEAGSEVIERPYTFHVQAKSEVLTLTTDQMTGTGWYLENARARQESPLQAAVASAEAASFIALPADLAPRAWQPFTGYVEVGPHARVSLTRLGSGPLSIHIATAPNAPADIDQALPAAVLKPLSGDDRQASRYLELRVALTEQPLNGTLQGLGAIGGDAYSPEPASPPLLRAGEVSVVGRRLGSDLLYTVMAVPLRLGDEVRVLKQRASLDTPTDEGLGEAMAAFTCTFGYGRRQRRHGHRPGLPCQRPLAGHQPLRRAHRRPAAPPLGRAGQRAQHAGHPAAGADRALRTVSSTAGRPLPSPVWLDEPAPATPGHSSKQWLTPAALGGSPSRQAKEARRRHP